MVLLAIVARFNDETKNICKVKISGGINIQKLKWIGYNVHLSGVGAETQHDIATTTYGSGFQGHNIPNQIIVILDILNTNQIHIANSPQTDANDKPIHNSNPYSNGLPLVLGDTLQTIQMGLGGITFDIAKTIHNDIEVEVLKYSDTGELVAMDTNTPILVDATGAVSGTAHENAFGTTALQSLVLYFDYDFAKYF